MEDVTKFPVSPCLLLSPANENSPSPPQLLMLNDLALLNLLQLASPALPVGAYSYSDGLDTLVDIGVIDS